MGSLCIGSTLFFNIIIIKLLGTKWVGNPNLSDNRVRRQRKRRWRQQWKRRTRRPWRWHRQQQGQEEQQEQHDNEKDKVKEEELITIN